MVTFDEMAADGNLLGVAMQCSDLTMSVAAMLAVTGDVRQAADDDDLAAQWAQAAPESRACVLLSFAWRSRDEQMSPAHPPHLAYSSVCYAADLNEYARRHAARGGQGEDRKSVV